MAFASVLHELSTLIESQHPLVVIETVEERRARALVEAATRRLGLSFYEWSIATGLRFGADRQTGGHAIGTTSEPAGMLRHIGALDRTGVYLVKDFGPHLEDPVNARLLREACQQFLETRSTIVLTGDGIRLPSELRPLATSLELSLPSEDELGLILDSMVAALRDSHRLRVELDDASRGDLIGALRGLTQNQARQAIAYVAIEDGALTPEDVARVTDRKARLLQDDGLLQYWPPADNRFELGGFSRLEAWLERAQHGFTPEAAAMNLDPPRGVLMVGVQGCGKSLAAKVIARRWGQPLLKLDAGRLYDKYVGETDRNLRRALALAESMAPAVLWIDEIEKAFGTSGDAEADGGLSRRVQGHLLTWLQEKASSVFVVATANDVFSLPPELMRKGRFDEIFFVDLPRPEERRTIFEIHLRLRNQDPDRFDLAALAARSEGMSGAEIEQAVVAALYGSLHGGSPLSAAHLESELEGTVPLSRSRAEDIERLRAMAKERFVPVA